MERRKRLRLSDRELSKPAMTLSKRFVQRWDIHARQLDDGRYICVHEPVNVDHLFAHLRGEITLGSYVLNKESEAKFAVLDADNDNNFLSLKRVSNSLAAEGIPSYLEDSRRGGHMWLFFQTNITGKKARAFGIGLLAEHGVKGIEVFPKQERLGEGPGSLIRMPFGIHRLTEKRYGFIATDGKNLAPSIREQLSILSEPEMISNEAIDDYISYVSSDMVLKPEVRSGEATDTISERIKASTTVLEFISQYVDLKPVASGGLGKCPFHDDQNPSFGVNDEGNYWHCFAGCGGGSIIDFWMKWRKCDFDQAIGELSRLLF